MSGFVSCTKLEAELAKKQDVLNGCNGQPLPEDSQVPTCSELNTAIDAVETAIDAKQGQLKNCAGDDHAAGANVPSCAEMTAADTAAVTAAVAQAATNTEAAIDAILAPSAAFTAAVKTAETTTTIAPTSGAKTYSHSNEDGTVTVLANAQIISANAGNAIAVGTDGGLMLSIPAQLPDDQILSGDNAGTVQLTLTPDTTTTPGQTDYTIKADLKVAATAPNGSTNALQNTGDGFFVTTATDTAPGVSSLAVAANHPSTSDAEAATPAYVAAAIGAIPDASATERGLVNLTAGQVLGDGVKVMDSLFTRRIANVTTFDLTSADVFTFTATGATTFAVTGAPAAGLAAVIILDLTNGGNKTLTWWAGMKWEGGTQPTLTTSGRDLLGFMTHDGGTTWNGLLLGKDMK